MEDKLRSSLFKSWEVVIVNRLQQEVVYIIWILMAFRHVRLRLDRVGLRMWEGLSKELIWSTTPPCHFPGVAEEKTEINLSQNGDRWELTQDFSNVKPTLYHWDTASRCLYTDDCRLVRLSVFKVTKLKTTKCQFTPILPTKSGNTTQRATLNDFPAFEFLH